MNTLWKVIFIFLAFGFAAISNAFSIEHAPDARLDFFHDIQGSAHNFRISNFFVRRAPATTPFIRKMSLTQTREYRYTVETLSDQQTIFQGTYAREGKISIVFPLPSEPFSVTIHKRVSYSGFIALKTFFLRPEEAKLEPPSPFSFSLVQEGSACQDHKRCIDIAIFPQHGSRLRHTYEESVERIIEAFFLHPQLAPYVRTHFNFYRLDTENARTEVVSGLPSRGALDVDWHKISNYLSGIPFDFAFYIYDEPEEQYKNASKGFIFTGWRACADDIIIFREDPLFEDQDPIVHEFGHQLANLGDEYQFSRSSSHADDYGYDVEPKLKTEEPWNANLTISTDPNHSKWGHAAAQNLLSPSAQGAYSRRSGQYCLDGPCLMKKNAGSTPFCEVCWNEVLLVLRAYTGKDDGSPTYKHRSASAFESPAEIETERVKNALSVEPSLFGPCKLAIKSPTWGRLFGKKKELVSNCPQLLTVRVRTPQGIFSYRVNDGIGHAYHEKPFDPEKVEMTPVFIEYEDIPNLILFSND